jgi:hypothetical protein
MRNRIIPLVVALAACAPMRDSSTSPVAHLPTTEAADPAHEQYYRYEVRPTPAGETANFSLNVDYPSARPPARQMPWDGINFRTEPERYLRAVLQYCVRDLERADFNLANNQSWFHAPWLAREPLHGLTSERSSRPFELHENQRSRWENFAVGYYNDLGAYPFSRVWANRARPDTRNVRFPVGAVSCKLLFTRASLAEVPYLTGSKVWRVAWANGRTDEFRLLQFDVAVRDRNANGTTGWVFGTLMYFNQSGAPASTPFSFADMTPVGLMWGNDPRLTPSAAPSYGEPKESWINPIVTAYFNGLRTPARGFRTPHLGLLGRMNGPVDNPASACLACHARALTFPNDATWTPARRTAELPFNPANLGDDTEVMRFMRNLGPADPFLPGAESADYSLQLAMGIENYNAWRLSAGPSAPSLAAARAADAGAADDDAPWTQAVPEAALPSRGDTPPP